MLIKSRKVPLTYKTLGFRFIVTIVILGFLIPQRLIIPVEGATKSSYHPKSFWYYPWGKSVTHKGVDIFAKEGTKVLASTNGLVISCTHLKMGGNVVIILGPKWRFHYYAHLKTIHTQMFSFVNKNEAIGEVGTTGNAIGKPPHLHYAMVSLFPYFWKIDSSKQGWKKMFYLNPITYFQH
jgi:murein DD-endopeptidase MepM/ murein hydrolase activator NlpD